MAAEPAPKVARTSPNVLIRRVTAADLPAVLELIKHSFAAMIPPEGTPGGDTIRAYIQSTLVEIEANELSEGPFATTWLANPAAAMFVATDADNGCVLGCVGLKRKNLEEGELVRMSVLPTLRGGGVGALLCQHLLQFARSMARPFLRVVAVTANADAARFYLRQGFLEHEPRDMPTPDGGTRHLFGLCFYLFERLIKRVALVGGTHGNERVGVTLATLWTSTHAAEITRPTFSTTVVVGNPEAVRLNRRYVDFDLNRCFAENTADLAAAGIGGSEAARAAELDALLGPKRAGAALPLDAPADLPVDSPAMDFIVDMHSTTSAMGDTVILNPTDDRFAMVVAAHLHRAASPSVRLVGRPVSRAATWSMDSIAPSGLSIEVGPLPHGTLHHAPFDATRKLVAGILDRIEAHNAHLLAHVPDARELVPYSVKGGPGLPLPAPATAFWRVPFHEFLYSVDYPKQAELPLQQACVHPLLRDFAPLQPSDPVFLGWDGAVTTFAEAAKPADAAPHKGPAPPPSAALVAYFVNEAAYYEKSTAFCVAKVVEKPVY